MKHKFFTHFPIVLLILSCQLANGQVIMCNTCFFVIGPKAGTTEHFPNARSIITGNLCHDGVSSQGFGVRDFQDPVGSIEFNSNPPTITDITGKLVPVIANENIPKTGLATIVGGKPIVYIKTSHFNTLPLEVQTFLYAHEAGHHALGQIMATFLFGTFLGPNHELAADLFATQALINLDFSEDQFNVVFQFMSTIPADPTNYAGPIRVARMKKLLEGN